MENKIIKILNKLYDLEKDEEIKFLNIFNKLDESLKEKILVSLYKTLLKTKNNFKSLNLKLQLSSNSIKELKEKRNNIVNLDF